MAGTQTVSVRDTLVVEGSNIYEIVTTCSIPGTLPDTGIFLLSIVTPEDPKDDTLIRVIEVADITEFQTDRDAAVVAGEPSWRAAAVTLQFDDIETANAAWKEVESRISTLVEQGDAFNEEFETAPGGDTTVYPTVDLSEKNALITTFENTAQPVTDAEDARNDKQLECTQLTSDLVVVEDRLQEAETDLALYLQIQAEVGNVNTALPAISASITAANTQTRAEVILSAASTLEKSSIEVQLSAIDAQIITFNTQNSALNTTQTGPITSAVGTLQSRVTSLVTQKSNLSTQVLACNSEVAALQATVDTARTARETALADVIAVCPEFSP